jgi:DNA-binding FadR family transcriptional regulator
MTSADTLESPQPRRESQAGRISRVIAERIRDGSYPVGERIPSERTLATEFDVSRPVIREALSTVSALGILDVQMGRGAYVTARPTASRSVPVVNLQDVINVREVLEVGALELCSRGVDEAARERVRVAYADLADAVKNHAETTALDRVLHREIVRACGSPLMLSLWEGLENQIDETIRVSPHGSSMSQGLLEAHETLAGGVMDDRPQEAIAASRELHEDNRKFLRRLLG